MHDSLYQCGNIICRQIFNYDQIKRERRMIAGTKVRTNRCPYCGCEGYTKLDKQLINYLARMDKYRLTEWN